MTLDVRHVDTTIRHFEHLGTRVPLTLAKALNVGLTIAQRSTTQQVLQRVPLKEKTLRGAFQTLPAAPDHLEARLKTRGQRIPLIAYLDIRGGLRSGHGLGGRAYALGTVPGRGFLAHMPSGHRGVYERTGKSRLPIRELMGPNLIALMAKYRIYDLIMPAVNSAVRLAALKVTGTAA